jgi:hypothetical protein
MFSLSAYYDEIALASRLFRILFAWGEIEDPWRRRRKVVIMSWNWSDVARGGGRDNLRV